jgi:hypothetical protein
MPSRTRRRALRFAAVGLLAAASVVSACSSGAEPTAARRKPTTTTTTTTTTTAVPVATTVAAPLTGEQVAVEEAGRLGRPAVAVKIDNDPAAMPQFGLGAADMVVELRVEGISRFIGLFHSRDVGTVGPVRSARTSDPDLLAAFGRPIAAWSGGNDTVVRIMRDTPWVQNLHHDGLPGAYRREHSRRAPHNLLVDVPQLWAAADQPVTPPTPRFAYRDAGEGPAGRPVAGVVVPVGNPSTYVWDAGRGGWLRWASGRRHTDDSGTQLAPANVVVLGTEYVASSADRRSPEARTVGMGPAWVYTGGHEVAGTWTRADRGAPWTLLDAAGQPIELTPGTTWLALPEVGSGPAEVDPVAAQGLLTGP